MAGVALGSVVGFVAGAFTGSQFSMEDDAKGEDVCGKGTKYDTLSKKCETLASVCDAHTKWNKIVGKCVMDQFSGVCGSHSTLDMQTSTCVLKDNVQENSTHCGTNTKWDSQSQMCVLTMCAVPIRGWIQTNNASSIKRATSSCNPLGTTS